MKKWIFMTIVALTAMFAMVGCPTDGDDDSGPAQITITFGNAAIGNVDLASAPAAAAAVKIDKGSSLGSKLPSRSNAGELKFAGWFVGSLKIDKDTKFDANKTINATWYRTNGSGQLVNDDNSVVTDGSGNPITEDDIKDLTPGAELPVEPAPVDPPDPGVQEVTVIFNYDYDNKPTFTVTLSDVGSFEDDYKGSQFPTAANDTNLVRAGWLFGGWYSGRNGAGDQYTKDTAFMRNTTLYAKWIDNHLYAPDPSENAELIYLENGAYALYEFEIPNGQTLADFESVTFKIMVSEATKTVWNAGGVRHARLMGVYKNPGLTVTTDEDTNIPVKYLNATNYNAPWIANNAQTSTTINNTVATPNTWYPIVHTLRSGAHAEFNSANEADSTKTGTVFFGVGVSNQTSAGGTNMTQQFVQLIKDVQLIPTSSAGPGVVAITGTRPVQKVPKFPNKAYEVADFVAFKDPYVFAWRGEASQYNIDNWQEIIPKLKTSDFDRGTAPDPDTLEKVALHTGVGGVFTYINNNSSNQKGWVSFEEAGRANSQTSTVPSTIVVDDFKEAWYLELKADKKPNGDFNIVWMGGGFGWMQANAGNANQKEGVSEYIDNGDSTFTLRFNLPKALLQYASYYNERTEWAGLAFSYWGSGDTSNLDQLNITEAYLLVESAADPAEGISLKIESVLDNPPAGGNLIADVKFDGDITNNGLVITAASGLSDYRWYVGATKNVETGGTLTISPVSAGGQYTITLQAKRGGLWISQSVAITLKN